MRHPRRCGTLPTSGQFICSGPERAIYGGWGKVDVEDCIGAVNALVADGLVDPRRIVSRGGSSGGYTTLALATCTDLLSAAASYYGISKLEMIGRITDKLEAHYAELLLGLYPMGAYHV